MKLKIVFLVFLLTFPVVSTIAQEGPAGSIPTRLTLDLATEILLLRNPVILRERQNIVLARAGVTQARLRPNPEFDVASESYPLFESNPGPFFRNSELIARVGQPIELGGKRGKRTRVAEQEVEVSESLLQDTIRQLKLELKTRYYRVVLAKAELQLAQEVLGQFDEIIEINRKRFEQGEISGLDLARVETERRRFFDDLVAAELALKNAKTALLELLGANNLEAPFDVAETLVFQPLQAVTAEELQEQAMEARADLKARQEQVERERHQVAAEKSLGVPNITPFAGYKRNLVDNTVAFGLRVDLPLFNRNQGEVARAVARVDQAGYEVQRAELAVRSEVLQAHQAVQAEERRVRAFESTYVQTARKARDIAQASYRLGALDLIAFLDAERAYRETLRGYNQALFDHQIAVFSLETAVGKDF
ncbi:MAG: TolC family protein [Acidobacteria bacterium]|nr:TolC family protein [Acidobacteriota bacterium]